MSYDIYLNDPVTGSRIELDAKHDLRGGTYCMGGTREAWLNITYNYSEIYSRVLPPLSEHQRSIHEGGCERGIRSIYGLTGAESIPILQAAADQLGDDVDADYWKATEGNAKRPLLQLIALARLRPDGVWDGD